MNNLTHYFFHRYFKVDLCDKTFYFNLYLKAYFREKNYYDTNKFK